MTMRKITIKEIAECAGVSSMTVSNVINRKKNVSLKTKARILTLFEDNGYVPNELAQQMGRRSRKQHGTRRLSKNICVIRNDLKNYFYDEIFDPIEKNILASGYHIAFNYKASALRKDVLLRNKIFNYNQIDGIIISGQIDEYLVKKIKESRLPVVSIGNEYMDIFTSVAFDLTEATQLAVKHLQELGHKKIGYIGLVENNTNRRFVGYRMAMEGAGLPIEANWIIECQNTMSMECGEQVAGRFLKQAPEVTALLGHNDILSIGIMKGFFAASVKVPEDISVVGIDGSYIGDFSIPALTSTGVNTEEFGKVAIEMLIRQIKSQDSAISTILVRPILFDKKSCKAIDQ